jgi:phosphoribosyl 1,2-cyclic phosphodiesterase
MKLTILGSGSDGNAALLCSKKTTLLVDCGLNIKELAKRMAPIGPQAIDQILIGHVHGDHIAGIDGLVRHGRKYGKLIPCRVSSLASRDVIAKTMAMDAPPFLFYEPGLPFYIGDILVDPFTAMHDSIDGSVAFKFTLPDGTKIGYAVDLGFIPPAMPRKFIDCNVIVIESNHDIAMLEACDHPQSVKDRVAGRVGHLSNDQTAEFLGTMNGNLKTVVLMHLSNKANLPNIAWSAAQSALDRSGSKAKVLVASQSQPLKVY